MPISTIVCLTPITHIGKLNERDSYIQLLCDSIEILWLSLKIRLSITKLVIHVTSKVIFFLYFYKITQILTLQLKHF